MVITNDAILTILTRNGLKRKRQARMCRPVKENFPFVEVRFNRQQAGNRKADKMGPHQRVSAFGTLRSD